MSTTQNIAQHHNTFTKENAHHSSYAIYLAHHSLMVVKEVAKGTIHIHQHESLPY